MIEAVLYHESGTMQSRDTSDVYGTRWAGAWCSYGMVLWTIMVQVVGWFMV